MMESSVSMQEMAVVCGLLSRMAKDFADADLEEHEREDAARLHASFVEAARNILSMLMGQKGTHAAALEYVMACMEQYRLKSIGDRYDGVDDE